MAFFTGSFKKLTRISFGLVTTFFLLWLIFHTKQYIPEQHHSTWLLVFLSYGILLSLVYANADIRNKLFDVSLVSFFPRFMIFFLGGLVFFYLLLSIVDPIDLSLFAILANIPLWLAMVHAFVFATIESAVWQGYLDHKIGMFASPLLAGIFHYGVWTGGAIVVIFSASLLFLFFSYVNYRFRISKNDLVPVIAVHTAYNFIKLGIMLAV